MLFIYQYKHNQKNYNIIMNYLYTNNIQFDDDLELYDDVKYMYISNVIEYLPRKYLLVKYLGSGGFGTVFKAIDKTTYNYVVIKITSDILNHNESYIYKIIKCENPNLMCLKEYINSDKYNILIIEYIDGIDLIKLKYTSSFNFTLNKKIKIILDVCSAVKFLHDKHILHLDIKPENILYSFNPERAVLFDYGLSCMYGIPSNDEDIKLLCNGYRGTTFYMSPEIKDTHNTDVNKFTPACDIYSMGIVFYVILTDFKNNRNPFISVPNVSKDIESMILRMLNENPKSRPTINEVYEFFRLKLE